MNKEKPHIEIEGIIYELQSNGQGCANCALVRFDRCADRSGDKCLESMAFYWLLKKLKV